LADVLVWLGQPSDAPPHPHLIQVHAKSDLDERRLPDGAHPVSVITGNGLAELLRTIEAAARSILPVEDVIALNRRQATHVREACGALLAAGEVSDWLLIAEELRQARAAFDRLTGRAGVDDMLDALFGRFCLGK
jgi:tRNA modification GTPase